MYRLVGFDFDGTLADSGDWFFTTMNDLASEFGFKKMSVAERDFLRGLDTRQILNHLEVPLWKLPRIVTRMRTLASRDRDAITLFPGVTALFESLQTAGIQIAIVTSNTEATVRYALGEENAAKVAHYECGSSLFGKAAKLKTVLRKTKVSATDTLYIGDETRDAIAARQVKMAFGAVAWGYASLTALEAHSPDFVFQSIGEMARQLTSI
jgi:phosphoglycolate phosphatase